MTQPVPFVGAGWSGHEYVDSTKLGTSHGLRILSLNARSFYKHEDQIKMLLSDTIPDIFLMQETWESDITPSPAAETYNLITKTFRHKHRGGGTCIFTKPGITSKERPDLKLNIEREIETCAIELERGNSKNIIIVNVYLGFKNRQNSEHILYQTLRQLLPSNKEIIVLGDFNTNFLNVGSDSEVRNFVMELETMQLTPKISIPTRVECKAGSYSATCIDNIFSTGRLPNNSRVLTTKISDHFPICHDLTLTGKKRSKEWEMRRQMKPENVENAEKYLLKSGLLKRLNGVTDVNSYAEILQESINVSIEICCPLKKVKIQQKCSLPGWMTKGIRISYKKRDKLFQRYNITKSPIIYNRYTDYLSILNRVKRAAKKLHTQNEILCAGKNIRRQWAILNQLMHRGKKSSEIGNLLHNGETISDDRSKANIFNDYFSNIGQKLASTFPSNNNWENYVTTRYTRLAFKKVGVADIDIHVKKLLNKTSHGWDLLTNNMLKKWSYFLSYYLAELVNLSISQSTYPTLYKKTRVIPLHKGGSKTTVTNYRPISLAPVISKIIEKVICEQTTDYLTQNNIIPKTQFGFRKGHQTSHLLQAFVNDLMKAKRKSNLSLAIFCDYSKAFDTLSHEILIGKMKKLGFNFETIKWFQSYLSGRVQYVDVNGTLSDESPLKVGTPQGSILGPLLYLIYTCDLPDAVNLGITLCFADDTTIHVQDDNLNDLMTKGQLAMDRVCQWSRDNKLTLNASKTKFMIFTKEETDKSITANDTKLERVKTFKLVGVNISSNLKWDEHCNAVANKVRPVLWSLFKIKNRLDTSNKLLLYNALITSHMSYALPIWQGCTVKSQSMLQTLMNKGQRAVFNLPPRTSTKIVAAKNNILSWTNLARYSTGTLVKATLRQTSPSLLDLFPRKEATGGTALRSHSEDQLVIPPFKTKMEEQQLPVIAPYVWNSIPQDIKTHSYSTFKKNLKKYYLSSQL